MKIFIGADHSGYELKETLKKYLGELDRGYEVIDNTTIIVRVAKIPCFRRAKGDYGVVPSL